MLSGILIDVKEEHPSNAEELISVTLSGIIVFWHPTIRLLFAVSMIALQLLRLSYLRFCGDTFMCFKDEQHENTLPSIVTILQGILIEVREEHPSNAE